MYSIYLTTIRPLLAVALAVGLAWGLMGHPRPANAEELSGDEIVQRADQVMIGDSAAYDNHMTIKRPNLRDQIYIFKTYFRERGRKVLIRMRHPPKEVGKDLLLSGGNMWQYIPNIERSVRIAGTQRFMGGDFSNSDLLNVSLVDDYDAKLQAIEEIDGRRCYVLLLKAASKNAIYDRVNYWVQTESFVPYREEYVTLSGKTMKTLTYHDIGPLGNRLRPRRLEMINSLNPTHTTVVRLMNAEYDKRISNTIFTRTYLERKRR